MDVETAYLNAKMIDWCAEGNKKSVTFDEEYVAVEANIVAWWSRDCDNLIMWRGHMCCFSFRYVVLHAVYVNGSLEALDGNRAVDKRAERKNNT